MDEQAVVIAAETPAIAEAPKPAPEQCVILVGGLGTRLGALTQGLPKPLTPVGDRPFLAYLLWHARRFGFRRVLLLAGHRSEAVEAFAADPRWTEGLEVSIEIEPEPLGTGGALRRAVPKLDERFLLLNGDSVFDFNWLDLCALANENPVARVCMGLRHQDNASRYGVVDLAGARIGGFHERGESAGGAINGGVYLIDRSVAEACPEKGSFEADVLPTLAADGQVFGRVHPGFFLDIGVPDALAAAQTLVPESLARGAVFFDRDGVLNVDHGYTHLWEDFEWVEGAIAGVKLANDCNLFVFLTTNQSGVARGYYQEAAIQAMHGSLQQALRAHGAHLDDIRYCPHHPDGVVAEYAKACDWRKPGPGMLLDLARRWPVRMGDSWMIGDNVTDIQAAEAAGVRGSLFKDGPLDQAVAAMIGPARAPARA